MRLPKIEVAIRKYNVDVIELPYATGKDGYLGYRIIGAFFLVRV